MISPRSGGSDHQRERPGYDGDWAKTRTHARHHLFKHLLSTEISSVLDLTAPTVLAHGLMLSRSSLLSKMDTGKTCRCGVSEVPATRHPVCQAESAASHSRATAPVIPPRLALPSCCLFRSSPWPDPRPSPSPASRPFSGSPNSPHCPSPPTPCSRPCTIPHDPLPSQPPQSSSLRAS